MDGYILPRPVIKYKTPQNIWMRYGWMYGMSGQVIVEKPFILLGFTGTTGGLQGLDEERDIQTWEISKLKQIKPKHMPALK